MAGSATETMELAKVEIAVPNTIVAIAGNRDTGGFASVPLIPPVSPLTANRQANMLRRS